MSRRIRAQHPTLMRVCIRKSSYSMPQLINQAINQQERNKQQLACRSGDEPARTHALAESNTISNGLAPHAHRPLESGPRAAPLTQCVGSHPSHETCGMVSHGACVHNIRQKWQFTSGNWTVAWTINNQQSINKQNNKSRSPGAEFQKEFKEI